MKIVVVGAGLTGAYSAYFLARQGADVIVIDPHHTPGRASDVNPGGLNPLHGPGIPGPVSAFALYCQRLHREEWCAIGKLSGIDFHPRTVSRLMLAFTSEELGALSVTQNLYAETAGFAARHLEAEELRGLPEGINPEAIGGVLTEGNASVHSANYTRAILKAAEKAGARVVTGLVVGVTRRGRQITTLQTGRETMPADQVVFCTGPHGEMRELLGEAIPVKAVKGELLLAELDRNTYRHDITWHQFGLYHAGGNRFWLGGTRDDSGSNVTTSDKAAKSILDGIRQLVPSISKSAVRDHQYGLRPMSPDGLPLLGRMRRWDNGYIANGGGVKGVLFSAGMADSIARLILKGEEGPELVLFSPCRFSEYGNHRNA
jgi:glycine oxidase